MCGCVSQLPLPHVNEQSKALEKVGSNDGLLDVCDEDPWEGATETEAECEGALAVCSDGSVVHCSQGELVWCVLAIRVRGRDDTHLGPRKHMPVTLSTT